MAQEDTSGPLPYKELDTLATKITDLLRDRIVSGEATPADVRNAIDWLKYADQSPRFFNNLGEIEVALENVPEFRDEPKEKTA